MSNARSHAAQSFIGAMALAKWPAVVIAAVAALGPELALADNFNGLDVTLNGTATIPSSGANAGNLLLTPSAGGGAGTAWLTNPISTSSAFSTTFNFNLSNVGGIGNADGIALVFQNTGINALGSSGGNLSIDIPDNMTPGGSVAAVLQTFWGTYGIVQNTDANGGPFTNSQSIVADLSSASVITGTETVSYDPTTQNVSQSINLDYTSNGTTTPLVLSSTSSFNLNGQFGPTMIVGLTGATGAGSTDQAITAWTVSAVPEPSAWALAIVGLLGIGVSSRRMRLAV